jgi:hypothetical protein
MSGSYYMFVCAIILPSIALHLATVSAESIYDINQFLRDIIRNN